MPRHTCTIHKSPRAAIDRQLFYSKRNATTSLPALPEFESSTGESAGAPARYVAAKLGAEPGGTDKRQKKKKTTERENEASAGRQKEKRDRPRRYEGNITP